MNLWHNLLNSHNLFSCYKNIHILFLAELMKVWNIGKFQTSFFKTGKITLHHTGAACTNKCFLQICYIFICCDKNINYNWNSICEWGLKWASCRSACTQQLTGQKKLMDGRQKNYPLKKVYAVFIAYKKLCWFSMYFSVYLRCHLKISHIVCS